MKRSKHLWASESIPWACALIKKGTLRKGITTSCIEIAIILKTPANCFEVRSPHITMATVNMDFSRLLAPFVDENIMWELTWYMIVYDLKFT